MLVDGRDVCPSTSVRHWVEIETTKLDRKSQVGCASGVCLSRVGSHTCNANNSIEKI